MKFMTTVALSLLATKREQADFTGGIVVDGLYHIMVVFQKLSCIASCVTLNLRRD